MVVRHFVTAEELERMGERDFGFELVRGELIPVSPAGREHGALTAFLTAALDAFVRPRGLGRVYADTGFTLFTNPDTVRGPDVSVVSRDRDLALKARRGFIPGPPDLAVEIASSDKTPAQLSGKAADYLAAGARIVWIVDPETRCVAVHRPGQLTVTLSSEQALDGGDVLPGFSLSLSRLFAELD